MDLYQDDGLSQEYLTGSFHQTAIEVIPNNEQTIIKFSISGKFKPITRNLKLILINKNKGPFWVSVNGQKIKQYLHRETFENQNCGWYYSNSKGAVEVITDFPHINAEIIVSFAHFDLIGM